VASALQEALRGSGRPIVSDSSNPYERVWELMRDPEESRQLVEVEDR
jgi:hypothetical protein